MNNRVRKTGIVAMASILAGLAWLAPGALGAIPVHPDELEFEPLNFDPPAAQEFRYELSNGVPVYMAPTHEFPLIDLTFTFKGGEYLEPADKPGLASMTGSMIRRGGTTSVTAEEVDERFDFMAANVSTYIGQTQSGASLNSLVSNFDESFSLFIDMVRNPGFQQDKIDIMRDEMIEGMKQRNDRPGSVLSRELDRLYWGEEHFEGRVATKQSIDSITLQDMQSLHRQIFQPGNLLIAVSGDFENQEMLSKLESALAGWKSEPRVGDPPAPTVAYQPGVYHIEKDFPQGNVAIFGPGIERDDPDYITATIMNDILGGGGFTSRITSRVRSDEGLAYSAGSSMSARVYYPGIFRAGYQSKNRTVALAAKIIFEELGRIRDDLVSAEELETSQNQMIETFPRIFESKPSMLNVFVNDELTNRPADYWQNYRDNVRSVTPEDVRQVANRVLNPEAMAIFVVGKWDEIAPGDLEGRASMDDFFGGSVEHLPLRDPLTDEPIEE